MRAATEASRSIASTLPATSESVPESSLLRAARWGVYATSASLPLYVVRWHYGPLPTTLLETLIIVTVGLYVVARLRQRELRPVRTPYDIAIVVLLAAAGASVVVASDHRAALGLYRAYFLEPVALFYVAIDVLRRSEHLQRLVVALAAGSSAFAVLNLIVFYQALIHNTVVVGMAPSALYGDANPVAMYLEPPFALAAGIVMLGQGVRWRALGAAWLVLTGAALLTSFSKGAYLALLVLALVVVLTVPRWRWALGISLAAALVLATQVPLLMARLATVVSSIDGRQQMWSATLQMIRDNPVFGVGLGNYHYLFRGVWPEIYPHDMWLTFWVETGFFGVLAFAVIIFGLLWRGWRAWPQTSGFYRVALWGMLGGLVLWLVHGLVDSPYWKNDMSAEFWLLAAVEFGVLRVLAGQRVRRPEPEIAVHRLAVVNDVAGVGRLQASVLRNAGYDVDFIDLPKPGALWPLYAKVLVLPVRLALYVPVVWRLRRTPYAWLHIHFLSYGWIGLLSGKTYYLHGHGYDVHTNLGHPLVGWISRAGMRGARAIFFVTPDLAPYLAGFGDKAHLLPNPLEPAFFEGVHSPTRLEKVLLFTRLYPIKAPEEVFEAAPELSKSVRLAAIDWGPLAPTLRERYGGYVEFMERVPHDEAPALVDRFDAVIGQMKLGILSLSELEGMARGRVVFMRLDLSLYPDDPPPVIHVENAAELVAAIRRLQHDPEELTRLQSEGQAWIARHHTADAHLRVLRAVFGQSEATHERSAPGPARSGQVEAHGA